MDDSSGESESSDLQQGAPPPRDGRRHTRRHPGAGDGIARKINTLASTLQDTNRNLRSVDSLLGQYRDYTGDQTEAMSRLRDNLEQSLEDLRSQRLSRSAGVRGASTLHSLHASDLDDTNGREGRQYRPTSPLRNYGSPTRHRRSRSVVRFADEAIPRSQLHRVHQSLRDLTSDQMRIGDDLDREIDRRNRVEVDTRRAMQDLSESLHDSRSRDGSSDRVERRLQEMEREMRIERELMERKQDQLGQLSSSLQEVLLKKEAKSEAESLMKTKMLKTESEKLQLEQDLERLRRKLDQSEGGRDALFQQIDELRLQLRRAEEERAGLQHQISQVSLQKVRRTEEEDTSSLRAVEREKKDLERQVLELKAQLNRSAVLTEMDELKHTLQKKEKEIAKLTAHVELLSADVDKRERHTLRMLEQLKQLQGQYEVCERERRRAEVHAEELSRDIESHQVQLRQTDQQLSEVERRRDELRQKAQESLRQWKGKCRSLERELDKQKEVVTRATEKSGQLEKESEVLRSQLVTGSQRVDGLKRELDDVLAKRAQQEEIIRRKDSDLGELRLLRSELERELGESRERTERLEVETQRRGLQAEQLREENRRLEEEIAVLSSQHERDRQASLQLQKELRDQGLQRAEIAARLTEEERLGKELRTRLVESREETAKAQAEVTQLERQLALERDTHHREAEGLRIEAQVAATQHEASTQKAAHVNRQELAQLENHIESLKAELVGEKSSAKSVRARMDKMKVECDRLTSELGQREEELSRFRRKYQTVRQDLEKKSELAASRGEREQQLEEETCRLGERVAGLETELESVLGAVGKEIVALCEIVSKDAAQVLAKHDELPRDPHRWSAEMKAKLQWVREELTEHMEKEQRLRRQFQQVREQLRGAAQGKDAERQLYMEQLTKQEKLLAEIHREKRDLLEKNRKRDEEVRVLQDRIADLEISTRVALDHLESVPEKLEVLEGLKDLEESHQEQNRIQERYSKYRESLGFLQHQLDESKRKEQEFDASLRASRLSALSSLHEGGSFLSSSALTDYAGGQDRKPSPDLKLSPLKEKQPSKQKVRKK
ncbi:centrosomal protein of 128 kDa isoform X2 [Petromyzon marinus]|uniref:Centrosomal protein of 128 kDa isoform X2 n=1 Tax=Petromyzon marinus TaxID=7757 RepID=A0AAJ7X3I6_PETMA|nr:centrosomal protein of 128 kDa isoform X2 [Petromyzon marinus]